MGFCSKCGEKLPDDAVFCPRCGLKIAITEPAETSTLTEEWRQTLARLGETMDKALATATKEMEKAYRSTREAMRETFTKKMVTCANCNEKNSEGSTYCNKCGKRLKQA